MCNITGARRGRSPGAIRLRLPGSPVRSQGLPSQTTTKDSHDNAARGRLHPERLRRGDHAGTGYRGGEDHRGPVADADRLDPAEEGPGRHGRRSRGPGAGAHRDPRSAAGAPGRRSDPTTSTWTTSTRTPRCRSAPWAASAATTCWASSRSTAATCSAGSLYGCPHRLLIATSRLRPVAGHRHRAGRHRRLLRRLGGRGHLPDHGRVPGLPAAAVRASRWSAVVPDHAFGLSGDTLQVAMLV